MPLHWDRFSHFAAFEPHFNAPTTCLLFRWYFAVISVSGVFAVTFSVIFAYVADITQEHERSTAYGLVRTFSEQLQIHWRWIQSKITCVRSSAGASLHLSPTGVGYLCCQPGHQPCHWSLPVWSLRRHVGRDPGHSHRPARHLLHPGGRAGVPAREDEASIMGSPHLLGTGWPFCCE